MKTNENPSDCGSQNGKAKSRKAKAVAQIARIVRREGLDYQGWRYVAKKVRQKCDLRPGKRTMASTFRGDVTGEIKAQSDISSFYLTHGNSSGAMTNTIYTFVAEDTSPTVTAYAYWRDAYASID